MTKPYLTIGAVFRRETRYLREWLEFHRLMGAEKFYLFNHDLPEDQPASDRVLAPYVDQGIVENIHFDVIKDFQMVANCGMIERAKQDGATWLAILDLDEFLFSPRYNSPVLALPAYESQIIGGVVAWWRCYGTSNLRYPPMLQTEAFTMRAKDDFRSNYSYKYIFRPDRLMDQCVVKDGCVLVDETSRVIKNGKQPGPAEIFRINHYATRSQQDWKLRVRRGLPPDGFRIDPKDLPNFYDVRWELFNRNDVEDTVIHRFLPNLKKWMDIES